MVAATTTNQVCPNCGDFVPTLGRLTGWCKECSKVLDKNTLTDIESFLLRNADHIEHFLLQGKSFNEAIDSLRHEIAMFRTCACCGGVIQRGSRNSVFCRKTQKCRATARKYVYLYDRKGLTKAEALSQVLETLNGSE